MQTCPQCLSNSNIIKNGFNKDKKQNYLCKNCKRQYIDRTSLVYTKRNANESQDDKIIRMLERGCGIRDIEYIEKVSRYEILKVITNFSIEIKPKQQEYKSLQIDEMWSYVKKKTNKKWLIYVLAPETGEILAFVVGKRNTKTVKRLYEKIVALNIKIQQFCTDDWPSFLEVFGEFCHKVGKKFTTMIEGVNCLIRHRLSRFVRKTCCFSKKLENHINSIMIVISNINRGSAWAT